MTYLFVIATFMWHGIYGRLEQKVEFCNGETVNARDFELDARISGKFDPLAKCICEVQLYNGSSSEVRFYSNVYGCNYRAKIELNGNITTLDCDAYEHIIEYTIHSKEVIKIDFVPYNSTTDVRSYFTFSTSFFSHYPRNNLTATCFKPIVLTTVVTTQPTTSTIPSTTQPINAQPITSTQPPVSSTIKSTQLPCVCQSQTQQTSSSTIGIAIGCFIGGTLFGIVLLVGIYVLRKKQTEKSTLYASPKSRARQDDEHVYDAVNSRQTTSNVEYVNTVVQP